MLLDSVVFAPWGSRNPRNILLADADSWLFDETDGDAEPTLEKRNALAMLLKEKEEKNLEMIGARSRCTGFTDQGAPDFDQNIHPIYAMTDHAYGKQFKVMVGGATVGDFETVLTMLTLICHRYPGSRTEDLHYTLLANGLDLRWDVSEDIAVTNRVNGGTEQFERWLSGSAALRKLYPPETFDGVMDSKAMLKSATEHTDPETIRLYRQLARQAKKNPDDLRRGGASWGKTT